MQIGTSEMSWILQAVSLLQALIPALPQNLTNGVLYSDLQAKKKKVVLTHIIKAYQNTVLLTLPGCHYT